MALNDSAVITAAVGYVYRAPVGQAAPTPAEITAFNPETYGCQVQTLTVTGSPTGGSFTAKKETADTPVTIAYNATPAQVQTALEGLASVGAGNVLVAGTSLTAGLTVTWIGKLQGTSPSALTLVSTGLTGGTTPAASATITTAANGYKNLGHTSRDDMPEFGFDGGDTTVKGSWQKKRLREIATGDPLADHVVLTLEQWDRDSLELYYGTDAASTPGVFGVNGSFNPIEASLLLVIVDGSAHVGFHAPKASIKRDDSINLPVDDFASLPVKATFLDMPGRRLYDWINETLFA